MSEAGLLGSVIGGVPLLAGFANMAKLERELAIAPDPMRRLGALAVLVIEDADRLRDRLRLTNAEHGRLASMADCWWSISAAMTMHEARTLVYRIGPDRFLDRALLAWARTWPEGVADERWHDLVLLPERWTAPAFPLTARDFVARGVEKGPALGAALRAAEEAWLAQDFPMDRGSLEQIAAAASGRP
jgi:poly(A) polymerase